MITSYRRNETSGKRGGVTRRKSKKHEQSGDQTGNKPTVHPELKVRTVEMLVINPRCTVNL